MNIIEAIKKAEKDDRLKIYFGRTTELILSVKDAVELFYILRNAEVSDKFDSIPPIKSLDVTKIEVSIVQSVAYKRMKFAALMGVSLAVVEHMSFESLEESKPPETT